MALVGELFGYRESAKCARLSTRIILLCKCIAHGTNKGLCLPMNADDSLRVIWRLSPC